MRRFLALLFVYVAVFLLLFAAAARAGQPPQGNTAATTGTDAASAEETAPRALPAPLDGIFPGSDYLGPTPLIGSPS